MLHTVTRHLREALSDLQEKSLAHSETLLCQEATIADLRRQLAAKSALIDALSAALLHGGQAAAMPDALVELKACRGGAADHGVSGSKSSSAATAACGSGSGGSFAVCMSASMSSGASTVVDSSRSTSSPCSSGSSTRTSTPTSACPAGSGPPAEEGAGGEEPLDRMLSRAEDLAARIASSLDCLGAADTSSGDVSSGGGGDHANAQLAPRVSTPEGTEEGRGAAAGCIASPTSPPLESGGGRGPLQRLT
jgi:hypothetical protein